MKKDIIIYEDKGCHLEPLGKIELINNGIFDTCYTFYPVFTLTDDGKYQLYSVRIAKKNEKTLKEKK